LTNHPGQRFLMDLQANFSARGIKNSSRLLTGLIDRLFSRKSQPATPLIESLEQRQMLYDGTATSFVITTQSGVTVDKNTVIMAGDTLIAKLVGTAQMDAFSFSSASLDTQELSSPPVSYLYNFELDPVTLPLQVDIPFTAIAGSNNYYFQMSQSASSFSDGQRFNDTNLEDNSLSYPEFYVRSTDVKTDSVVLVNALGALVTDPAPGDTVYAKATISWQDVDLGTVIRNEFTGNGLGAGLHFEDMTLATASGSATVVSSAYVVAAGGNTLTFEADSLHNLRESDETNNTFSDAGLTIIASGVTDGGDGWNMIFSEPIDLASFTWESFSVTQKGGSNIITASSKIAIKTVSDSFYTVYGINPPIGQYTYSITPAGVKSQGLFKDALTNSMSDEFEILPVMASLPVLAATNPGPYQAAYTSSLTPTVVGTAVYGTKISIFDDSFNFLGTTTADSTGHYAVTLSKLSAGDHTISVGTYFGNVLNIDPSTVTFHIAADLAKALQITQFPTPLAAPVTAIGLQFNKALDLNTFTWEDLDIRNGSGGNLSNPGITIERTSPTSLWYRITLPAVTTASGGTYTVQVESSGINTADNRPVSDDISTTFTRTANKFLQITQFPTPYSKPVTSIGFQVSAALDLTSLDWSDIQLTRDGGPDLSDSGITIERTSPTSLWYRINIPGSLNLAGGDYTLTIKKDSILDFRGANLDNDISTYWNRPSGKFLQITQFPLGPRGLVTLVGFQSSIELNLATLDWNDIILSDLLGIGGNISQPTIIIERPSPTSLWYRIKLPPSMTAPPGLYTLRVVASGVEDINGNPMTQDAFTFWLNAP
jgi:hypothetical protein